MRLESAYRLCVVKANGDPVFFHPGSQGERDLIEAATEAIVAKGVGVFRTEVQVRQAIRDGLIETLKALKSEVQPT